MKTGVTKTVDKTRDLIRAIDLLASSRVMVGIPQEKDARDDGKLGNADIGYLMENGMPEHNVPARPHMVPGVRSVQRRTEELLRQAATLALEGRPEAVTRALNAVGLTNQSAIRAIIRAGIPPSLADSTLKARARRGRRGARQELRNRASGVAASVALAKPLIDTGQYIAAITYVIRRLRGRGA